ncbi:MAG TPA: zinc ribbon domain-containing protein [Methanomicrobiales archaeon]|jgi:predicted amidophosphoribosyltransferase|nr:zinc ribbon domain-containing protein [Methanomicrobiales archaeon]
MAKNCPNCGKDTSGTATYCSSCGAYIPENVGEKVKELKENIEVFNITREALIFAVYIVAFTTALYAWQVLDVPSWEWRLLGSLAIAVLSVLITRFLLNRYLL